MASWILILIQIIAVVFSAIKMFHQTSIEGPFSRAMGEALKLVYMRGLAEGFFVGLILAILYMTAQQRKAK